MMMLTATFTAVATPHALVIILTVSHDLLFHQPLLLVKLFNSPEFARPLITRCHRITVSAMIASAMIAPNLTDPRQCSPHFVLPQCFISLVVRVAA
jgi:hypothetical protein